jgi:hypothetical protein
MKRLSGSATKRRTPAMGSREGGGTRSGRQGNGRRRGLLVGVGVVALMAILFNAFVSWLGKENWTMLPI